MMSKRKQQKQLRKQIRVLSESEQAARFAKMAAAIEERARRCERVQRAPF